MARLLISCYNIIWCLGREKAGGRYTVRTRSRMATSTHSTQTSRAVLKDKEVMGYSITSYDTANMALFWAVSPCSQPSLVFLGESLPYYSRR